MYRPLPFLKISFIYFLLCSSWFFLKSASYFPTLTESIQAQLTPEALLFTNPDDHFQSESGLIQLRLGYKTKKGVDEKTWGEAVEEIKTQKSSLHFSLFSDQQPCSSATKIFIPTDENFNLPAIHTQGILHFLGHYTLTFNDETPKLIRQKPAPLQHFPIAQYPLTQTHQPYRYPEPMYIQPPMLRPTISPFPPTFFSPHGTDRVMQLEKKIVSLEGTIQSLQLELSAVSQFIESSEIKETPALTASIPSLDNPTVDTEATTSDATQAINTPTGPVESVPEVKETINTPLAEDATHPSAPKKSNYAQVCSLPFNPSTKDLPQATSARPSVSKMPLAAEVKKKYKAPSLEPQKHLVLKRPTQSEEHLPTLAKTSTPIIKPAPQHNSLVVMSSLSQPTNAPFKETKKSKKVKDLSRFEVPSETISAPNIEPTPEKVEEVSLERHKKKLERAARNKEKLEIELMEAALLKEQKEAAENELQKKIIHLSAQYKFSEALKLRSQLNTSYPGSSVISIISMAQAAIFRPKLVTVKELNATRKKIITLLSQAESMPTDEILSKDELEIAYHFLIHFSDNAEEQKGWLSKGHLNTITYPHIVCVRFINKLAKKSYCQCSPKEDCIHLAAHNFIQNQPEGLKYYPEFWKLCIYTYASPCIGALNGSGDTILRESRAEEIIQKSRDFVDDSFLETTLKELTHSLCNNTVLENSAITFLNTAAKHHGEFSLAIFPEKRFIPLEDAWIEKNLEPVDKAFADFLAYDQTPIRKNISHFFYLLQKMMTPEQIKQGVRKYKDKEWMILFLRQASGRFSSEELTEIQKILNQKNFFTLQAIPLFWQTKFNLLKSQEDPLKREALLNEIAVDALAFSKGFEKECINRLAYYADSPLCKELLTHLDTIIQHSDYSDIKKLFIRLHQGNVLLHIEGANYSEMNLELIDLFKSTIFSISELEQSFAEWVEHHSHDATVLDIQYASIFKTLTCALIIYGVKEKYQHTYSYIRKLIIYPFLEKLLESINPINFLLPMKVISLPAEDDAFILSLIAKKIETLPEEDIKKHYKTLLQATITRKRSLAGSENAHFFSELPHEKVDLIAFQEANNAFHIDLKTH